MNERPLRIASVTLGGRIRCAGLLVCFNSDWSHWQLLPIQYYNVPEQRMYWLEIS
jgi:hypothetical protein